MATPEDETGASGPPANPGDDLVQSIRRANREFYRAFESLEIERMSELWLRTDGIKCIHPGWKPLLDWDSIMESWQQIFSGTGYIEFDIADETIFVNNDLAVVSLFEKLKSVQGGQTLEGAINATNVYLKRDDTWKMIIHQAS